MLGRVIPACPPRHKALSFSKLSRTPSRNGPCGHVAEGIDPNGPVGVTSPPEPLGQSCQAPAGLPGFIVEPHDQDPVIPWRCICSKQHGPGLVRLPGWLEEIVTGWLASWICPRRTKSEYFIGRGPKSGCKGRSAELSKHSLRLSRFQPVEWNKGPMTVLCLCETRARFAFTFGASDSICCSRSLLDAVAGCRNPHVAANWFPGRPYHLT